jgi:hypothetical protein
MTTWKMTSSSGMGALYRPESSTLPAKAGYSDPGIHIGHLKRNAAGSEEWSDSDRAQMKHYILTWVGDKYDIWVLRANFSEDSNAWNGCSMTHIEYSVCSSKAGVRRLESWINEIHRWGLSVHAPGCQADAKAILEQQDVEVSLIE